MLGWLDVGQIAGEEQSAPHDPIVTLAAGAGAQMRIKTTRFPFGQYAVQVLRVPFQQLLTGQS